MKKFEEKEEDKEEEAVKAEGKGREEQDAAAEKG